MRRAAVHHESKEYVFLFKASLRDFYSSFSGTIAVTEVRGTELVFNIMGLSEGVELFTAERAYVVGSQELGDSVTSK